MGADVNATQFRLAWGDTMKSKAMGRRLGAMALLLTVAGLAGPFAAAGAAPLEMVTRAQFEAWFKEISNWGRWGKDDELGTLNLITPEKRKLAAALARDGVSVSLSLELNKDGRRAQHLPVRADAHGG
jgi:hypothetical protein